MSTQHIHTAGTAHPEDVISSATRSLTLYFILFIQDLFIHIWLLPAVAFNQATTTGWFQVRVSELLFSAYALYADAGVRETFLSERHLRATRWVGGWLTGVREGPSVTALRFTHSFCVQWYYSCSKFITSSGHELLRSWCTRMRRSQKQGEEILYRPQV